MRLVTVHLPAEYLRGLDELVRLQKYSSRAEVIRMAIRDLLKEELWQDDLLKQLREELG
ncbi:MAG: ribbon-helix-helix domain-containing protein [Candidatus Kariarchaeaceae archaeon]|jgi:Arc/MetJ-type ribon-helix-helix transcriptional regulator